MCLTSIHLILLYILANLQLYHHILYVCMFVCMYVLMYMGVLQHVIAYMDMVRFSKLFYNNFLYIFLLSR